MKFSSLTFLMVLSITLSLIACKEGVKKDKKPVDVTELVKDKPENLPPAISEDEIQMTNPLNHEWKEKGEEIYELKCRSCHNLTEIKLVGPGWKEVTKRRTPGWIMNMIVHTDMMLDKDPEAMKLLELCMVRMPNQSLTKDDARHVIEFMRENDGEK